MEKHRKSRSVDSDSQTIGWISIAELFLLVGIVMIAVAALLDSDLTVAAITNEGNHDEISQLKATVKLKDQKIEDRDLRIKTLNSEIATESLEKEKAILLAGTLDTKKTAAERRAADAETARKVAIAEKDRFEQQVKALSGEQSAVVAALTQAEQARLAEETARKAAEAARKTVIEEKTRLTQQLTALQAAHAALAKLAEEQKNSIEKLEVKLVEAHSKILNPLQNEKLVVSIWCTDLPDSLDLDLYVQDPSDDLCNWQTPRILFQAAEIAVLILSEDLRRANSTFEDGKSTVEEKYYSTRLLQEPEKPYLVFAMLRQTGVKELIREPVKLARPITVNWQIEVKRPKRPSLVETGQAEVEVAGAVIFDKSYLFPGLTPLFGFDVTSPDQPEIHVMGRDAIPHLFRGWEAKDVTEDAKNFKKIRE